MGKSSGGSTSTTNYTLAPEQQEVLTDAMRKYAPGGQLPDSAPQFNYNSNTGLQTSGQNYIAGFNPMQGQAFGMTEATAGSNEPTLEGAQGATAGVIGANNNYGNQVERYFNPYVGTAVSGALGLMEQQRNQQRMQVDNNSVAAGSFGGTRQGVEDALNNQNWDLTEANTISGMLNTGFNQATGEFNAVNASNLAAANQLGNQGLQLQTMEGNDINALSAAGGQIQQNDQAMRDAARAAQMQDATYGMTVADAIAGLSPPPNSTTNTRNYVSPSSIWSNIGGSMLGGFAAMMSDEEAKKDVKDADPDDALAKIRKLIPKTFSYRPEVQASHGVPSGRRTGFMAQDVERATGHSNPRDGSGYQHVDLHEHIGRLTQAVQALDRKMQGRYGGERRRAA